MVFPTLPAILSQRQLTASELVEPSLEALLRIYAWMYLARTGDNRILDLFRQGLLRGTVTGGQGNEGLIVPMTLLADKSQDVVSFTHRDFGGHLIWSDHFCDHLNQYFANAASPTKAREGNVHHGDPKNRSLPMISHLGAMLSNVLGATDSQRRLGRNAVGFAIFGDGGSSTGDVHETLNLAALLSVPVVFVIENNEYAYSTPVAEQYAGVQLVQRAAAYGIEGITIDTTDVINSARQFAAAIEKARTSGRPILIEAKTLRLRGHAAYDTCDYLKPGESESFFTRDPLPRFRQQLLDLDAGKQLEQIEGEIDRFIELCVQLCLAVPRPNATTEPFEVYAPETAASFPWVQALDSDSSRSDHGEHLTLAQAINRALKKILTERSESIILGQDIGVYGGAFKVTEGLLKAFSRSRVFNTPLAESACTGYAIGMAVNGHRPIEEFQFADFSTEAATQIMQNAATFFYRSGVAVPLVLRLPCGGGLTMGSFHSQELESIFLAVPGIKGLYPSTPQDAFNALLAAYEDNNPVILFEHKGLYRRGKHEVRWDPNYRQVWQPKQLRSGDFATIVTYGEMVHAADDACAYLESEYEKTFDLFDLRCLSPLRLDEIRASIGRTHRLIVIHEGRRTHGFGAELVAQLTEELFFSLEAPPLRIASLDIPVPFATELEVAYRPSRDKMIEQIVNWMG